MDPFGILSLFAPDPPLLELKFRYQMCKKGGDQNENWVLIGLFCTKNVPGHRFILQLSTNGH